MYKTFTLREYPEGKIEGYSWHVENPEKTVIIIHGIGEYGGRFDRVAGFLNDAGFAVLSMDLRGHGNSLGEKGHCAPRNEVLKDIDALVDYSLMKYPGKEIIIYGHSMGGNITLDYRCRGNRNNVPVAYLVTAPWIILVRKIPAPLYAVVKILSRLTPSGTIGSEVDEDILGHPETVKPYNDNPMVHSRISFLCAIEGFETGRKLETASMEDNGRAADIPLLIMQGSEDKICDPEGVTAAAKALKGKGHNLGYILWEGLFHEIHNGNRVDRGDKVIEAIVKYCKDLKLPD
ncbi:MAG: alpha/beta fold hydrolase [Firmicutes bacterium]|nr:alpha/beta fold hydrolase [Bacillota bacterium]